MTASKVVEINKKKLVCGIIRVLVWVGYFLFGFFVLLLSNTSLYEIAERVHHLFFVCGNMGMCLCMYVHAYVGKDTTWELFLLRSP